MKKFYRHAKAAAVERGFGVELDGRPLRTPRRLALVVASRALAEAIAAEWQAQEDRIRPESMPLTRMTNSAIDTVMSDRDAVVDTIAAYGVSDLVCYWADAPDDLVARQRAHWQPLLGWIARRFDVMLRTTAGIGHLQQDAAALAALREAVAGCDDMELAALHEVTTITGSLVIGLAAILGEIDAEQAWQAGHVDAIYQAERWGSDPEAAARERALSRDLDSALEFLHLHHAG